MPQAAGHSPTAEVAPPGWRRLFHATAGTSLPVAGIFASQDLMVIALAVLAGAALALDLTRFRTPRLNRLFMRWLAPLLKRGEDSHFTGSTYMLIAALIVFIIFNQVVAVAALLFLSLGDPAAALVGQRTPGPRVSGKSPGGTAAFVIVSFLVVAALVGSGAVEYHRGLLLGALIAGLVELAPLPLNDNLTIPLVAGTAMHFLGV